MTEPPPDPDASPDTQRHVARTRDLSRNVMAFDLDAEAKQLVVDPKGTHTARTLAKLDTMRLTLMRMRAGSRTQEHQASHQVSIHTVSGHVVIHAQGNPVELPAGHVVVFARGIAHDVAATEDSVVLITVSAA